MKTFASPLPLLTLFLSMALMAVVASCSDDDQPAPEGPSIAGFTPNAALPGATVTITGTNFIATAAQNIVSFNGTAATVISRSEEHTSELQSRENLVCRLLLEKKKKNITLYFR